MKHALVTGATGFLGSHFLVNFLGREIGHAHVLVRGKDEATRAKKLTQALQKAAQSYSAVPSVKDLLQRITIVAGDISLSDLGVAPEAELLLKMQGLQEFWHFAASLNFENYKRDHIHSSNVDGALNAVNFSARLGIRQFVYCSTAYTSGAAHGLTSETLHGLDRKFSNFYEQTKCHAEHLVTQRCNSIGTPLTILRPSVVVGNSQTKRPAGTDTGLYGFIREVSRLKKALKGTQEMVRIFGGEKVEINRIPVDILMQDVGHLMKSNGLQGNQIHHLSCQKNLTAKRTIELICEALDIENLRFSETDKGELSALERLLGKRTQFYSSYLRSHKIFDRKIPQVHAMSEGDLRAFVIEGIKALNKEDVDSTFERHQLVTSDGVSLNVFSTGSTKEETVLLCNTVGMPVEFFRPLAEKLSVHCQVITWESRTIPSAAPTDLEVSVSVDRQADDAFQVTEFFNKKSVVVVGWCAGARLALRLNAKYPDRIKALALLNGGYSIPTCPTTLFEKNMLTVMPKVAKDPQYAELFHKAIFTRKTRDTADAEAEAQVASNHLLSSTNPAYVHLTSVPFHNASNLFRYARLVAAFQSEPPTLHEFDAVNVPSLVLTGSKDITVSQESSQFVAKQLRASQFACIDGADHFSLYGDVRFKQAIVDFVSTLSNEVVDAVP